MKWRGGGGVRRRMDSETKRAWDNIREAVTGVGNRTYNICTYIEDVAYEDGEEALTNLYRLAEVACDEVLKVEGLLEDMEKRSEARDFRGFLRKRQNEGWYI